MAIWPTSVAEPVATTTPRPLPDCTVVPMNSMLVRSPTPDSASTASVDFSTAALSPVRAASSTVRSEASMSRMSAGT